MKPYILIALAALGTAQAADDSVCPGAKPAPIVHKHHKHHKPKPIPFEAPAPSIVPSPPPPRIYAEPPLCYEPLDYVAAGSYRYYVVIETPIAPEPYYVYVPEPAPAWDIPVSGGFVETLLPGRTLTNPPAPTHGSTKAPELDAASASGASTLLLGLAMIARGRRPK
jgi:hypothetical protein